ncbi:hypothetical protein HanPI659440_Chr05g0200981 [Helianthus annuus]|nr:hypothetical protein HanPI659440_Chr05g0200981 [Helianthus annuus]
MILKSQVIGIVNNFILCKNNYIFFFNRNTHVSLTSMLGHTLTYTLFKLRIMIGRDFEFINENQLGIVNDGQPSWSEVRGFTTLAWVPARVVPSSIHGVCKTCEAFGRGVEKPVCVGDSNRGCVGCRQTTYPGDLSRSKKKIKLGIFQEK